MPIISPVAPIKRRRRAPEDSSSREASAESNDETADETDFDNDRNSTSSSSVILPGGPPLASRETFDATHVTLANHRNGGRRVGGGAGGGTVSSDLTRIDLDTDGISEGSAGHDGDVSSATGPSRSSLTSLPRHPLASTSQQDPIKARPLTSAFNALAVTQQPISSANSSAPSSPHHSPIASRHPGHAGLGAPPAWAAAPQGFLSSLTPNEIQEHIRTAIAVPDPLRTYRIMAPPVGRPVRIYADGVYDLLHYGHMLQLRQCKLAFPSVYLMVGVCSDELVRKHKASPVLTSAERYESVRHCKWVDEVVEDAPWCVDADFFQEYKIDYVAHDEEPYQSMGSDDVYAYAKSIGAFLPTKRTNGVSTSELLQRIVEGYREGEYDNKFIKLGLPDLCSTRNASEAGTTGSKAMDDLTTVEAEDSTAEHVEI